MKRNAPVPLSSLRVEVTTTSALLSCTLQIQQTLTALTLHNHAHQTHTHTDHTHNSSYAVRGLQPGAHYSITAELTTPFTHLNISLTQRLHTTMDTAQCPIGWLASGRSYYSVSRQSLSWGDAQQTCMGVASGGHLVDVKTETDLLLLSSHLTTHNNLLLLWTALNDRKEKRWPHSSDGSSYNMASAIIIAASQSDGLFCPAEELYWTRLLSYAILLPHPFTLYPLLGKEKSRYPLE
ncbi:uncharacterized protein LOC112253474 [Oncorhynchus tshawytscha]|uniref:uncharacterized protein LOC112253474 n=1 Tax=Oncorhynchus tshawytscha TaxID=74940 RepID=UPI000D0A6B7C|nr:uncharacterized protein LOC112253474 [Oncorhynchus tshawytscha]